MLTTTHQLAFFVTAALLVAPVSAYAPLSREPPLERQRVAPADALAQDDADARSLSEPIESAAVESPSESNDQGGASIAERESAARPTQRGPRNARIFGFPLAGYTPDTSVAFGGVAVLRFHTASSADNGPASTASLAAMYTLRQQWLIALDPSVRIQNDLWRVNSRMLLRNWNTDFYGVGADSREQDLEEYVPLSLNLDFEIQRAVLHRNLYVGATAQFSLVRMQDRESGGLLDSGDVVGSEGGRTAGPGFSLTWDSRDLQRFPSRGALIHAEFGGHAIGLGSDYDYGYASLDTRVFHDLGVRRHHILAARALLRTTGGDVPFYEMPQLGGQSLMRGIQSDRYRDHNLWATQLEYRTPVFWRIGFTAFGALGQVFRSDDPISALPEWSAGVGTRFRIDRESGLNVRLDYGISNESLTGIYFSVSEAF